MLRPSLTVLAGPRLRLPVIYGGTEFSDTNFVKVHTACQKKDGNARSVHVVQQSETNDTDSMLQFRATEQQAAVTLRIQIP